MHIVWIIFITLLVVALIGLVHEVWMWWKETRRWRVK